MGRELRRVPLDFDWPLKETWAGYLNPFYERSAECSACGGTGESPIARRMSREWYGNAPFDPVAYGARPITRNHPPIRARAELNVKQSPGFYGTGELAVDREAMRLWKLWRGMWSHNLIQADVDALIAHGRLMDFTHVPRTAEQHEIVRAKVAAGGNSWLPEPNGCIPSADEVNDWSFRGFGHDSINRSVCVTARAAREDISEAQCVCPSCDGDGRSWPSPEVKTQYETWERSEPPKGDGFQLWQTTSEGSPVSPVFKTLEDLCEWCARNATTFGYDRASAAEWRRMLDANFVCVEMDGVDPATGQRVRMVFT